MISMCFAGFCIEENLFLSHAPSRNRDFQSPVLRGFVVANARSERRSVLNSFGGREDDAQLSLSLKP